MAKERSIGRSISGHILLMLLATMTVVLVVSYFLVRSSIYQRTLDFSHAMVSVFGDWAVSTSEREHVPIDPDHPETIIKYGDYFCEWYPVDYAYAYVPNPENGTVTYIAVSANQEKRKDNSIVNYLKKYEVKYTLSPQELAVWNEQEIFADVQMDNTFGHEVSTLLLIHDSFGNKALVGIDRDYGELFNDVFKMFSLVALLIVFVICLIYLLVFLVIRRRVSRPLQQISREMQDFIGNSERGAVHLNEADHIREYAMIASAFNSMTEDIDNYLDHIGELNRQQEHQQAELDIAGKIQHGFLPPEQYSAPDCEIRAMMLPSKNIGGDLYDYIRLDENRTLIVVADVSGKGVSAALFMAVTLVIISQFARMDLPPSEILKRTNATLVTRNPALLFATVFLGIYDHRDQCLTYSNGGHNFPYLISDRAVELTDAAGTMLGMFEDEEYTDATVQLRAGDTVFLYTDGVNESVGPDRSFYGTDRLEKVLRKAIENHSEDIVASVREDVLAFSGETERHDDITMLAITAKDTVELSLRLELKELEKIKEEILRLPVSRAIQLELCLIAEEHFVNICSYAFPDGAPPEERVRFTLSIYDRIVMRFEAGGVRFDPTEDVIDPDEYDIDRQIGGLGNFIVVAGSDKVKYDYRDQKNILTFIKYFREESE